LHKSVFFRIFSDYKGKMRILAFMVVLFFVLSANAQTYQFANLKKENPLTAKAHHIEKYLNDFLSTDTVNVERIKLANRNKKYYLLAYDGTANMTYLIPLKRRFNRLFNKTFLTYLTGCGTEQLDIDQFDFSQLPLVLCKNCSEKTHTYRPFLILFDL
jgi:hypothetical protein